MNHEAISVSIVTACRNEARHIGAFLDSVFAQDMRGMEWEILVADGMSDDGTREILEQHAARHPLLRVLANPGRIVSTGLNAAIRAARGRIILRMDAHTRYAADYCRRCVEVLERTGAQNVGGPARTVASSLLGRAVAAAYHSAFSTGGGRFHKEDYEGWVDTVPYGCWRKETLEQLGLFDETLVRNQDDELNLRLLRAGGRIWQDPQIVSWYTPRHSLRGLFRQYFQYGFWKVAVIRKHRLPGSRRHWVPALCLLAGGGSLAAAVTAAAAGAPGWANWWAAMFAMLAGGYGTANLAASLVTARRWGWRILPLLPAVFITYHISYALGFLTGLAAGVTGRLPSVARSPAFTQITR